MVDTVCCLKVKRNVELELEAVRALQDQGVPISGHEDDQESGVSMASYQEIESFDEVGVSGWVGGRSLFIYIN